ncbi:alpha/beta fold hydrolase [Naasia sp. SYSU D00948]|uniref:alpha/beta fold hydrolase n=1 Tax=Naasia sp. SYSU D00948 TaxID=2817379 RepID=UPI001B312AF9|nr:alpha/beta hydrolase [Naasia sp. SYSU D00948]
MKHTNKVAATDSATDSIPIPAVEGVSHRFVELPGLRMHVAEAGAGEPLLLLHGALQNWWAWRKVIPGLARHYRVLAPDLRGQGWTDVPRSGYTGEQMVGDLVALLDALDLDSVLLVSTDMGAIPGYALCYEHPDRVRAHVAITVPPLAVKLKPGHLKAFAPLWHQEVGALPGIAPALFGRGRQPLARHMLTGFSAAAQPMQADEQELYLALLRQPERARATSEMFRHLVLPAVAKIASGHYRRRRSTTPTLIIGSTEDRSFPPSMLEDMIDTARPFMSGIELAIVDHAAHYVAQENPAPVVDHVLRFFHEFAPASR